jgi:hypothetical protein
MEAIDNSCLKLKQQERQRKRKMRDEGQGQKNSRDSEDSDESDADADSEIERGDFLEAELFKGSEVNRHVMYMHVHVATAAF